MLLFIIKNTAFIQSRFLLAAYSIAREPRTYIDSTHSIHPSKRRLASTSNHLLFIRDFIVGAIASSLDVADGRALSVNDDFPIVAQNALGMVQVSALFPVKVFAQRTLGLRDWVADGNAAKDNVATGDPTVTTWIPYVW